MRRFKLKEASALFIPVLDFCYSRKVFMRSKLVWCAIVSVAAVVVACVSAGKNGGDSSRMPAQVDISDATKNQAIAGFQRICAECHNQFRDQKLFLKDGMLVGAAGIFVRTLWTGKG